MRLNLLSGHLSRRWNRADVICSRFSCINDTSIRHFSQSLASGGDSPEKYSPIQGYNTIQAAFSPEKTVEYNKNRTTLSRLDFARKYRTEGLGPLSVSDIEVQDRLIQPGSCPAEILRQSINDSTLSVHVIRLCLETEYRRSAKLSRKERVEYLNGQKHQGLARLVLSCVWNDERLWTPLVIYDVDAIFHICTFAISEGLDEFVMDWAFVRIVDETSPLAGDGPHSVWRGHILRELLSAQGNLNYNNNADSMLRCMFRMIDKKVTADAAPDMPSVSLQPAACNCVALLCRTAPGYTDAALYDKFASWWNLNREGPPFGRLYHAAKLGLYHPHEPTETIALEALRAWHGVSKYPRQRDHHNRFLQRAYDVAMRNNNAKDAAWIKTKFADRLDPLSGRFAPLTKHDLAARRLEKTRSPEPQPGAKKRRHFSYIG